MKTNLKQGGPWKALLAELRELQFANRIGPKHLAFLTRSTDRLYISFVRQEDPTGCDKQFKVGNLLAEISFNARLVLLFNICNNSNNTFITYSMQLLCINNSFL